MKKLSLTAVAALAGVLSFGSAMAAGTCDYLTKLSGKTLTTTFNIPPANLTGTSKVVSASNSNSVEIDADTHSYIVEGIKRDLKISVNRCVNVRERSAIFGTVKDHNRHLEIDHNKSYLEAPHKGHAGEIYIETSELVPMKITMQLPASK
jgi:hypothetical protein